MFISLNFESMFNCWCIQCILNFPFACGGPTYSGRQRCWSRAVATLVWPVWLGWTVIMDGKCVVNTIANNNIQQHTRINHGIKIIYSTLVAKFKPAYMKKRASSIWRKNAWSTCETRLFQGYRGLSVGPSFTRSSSGSLLFRIFMMICDPRLYWPSSLKTMSFSVERLTLHIYI